MTQSGLRWHGLWTFAGWTMVGAVVWLSLMPAPPVPSVTLGDKISHLVAYGTLTLWFCQLHTAPRQRLAHAVGFAALGVALEYAQRATGYRSFEVADMIANTLGVALGWGLARAGADRMLASVERALGVPH